MRIHEIEVDPVVGARTGITTAIHEIEVDPTVMTTEATIVGVAIGGAEVVVGVVSQTGIMIIPELADALPSKAVYVVNHTLIDPSRMLKEKRPSSRTIVAMTSTLEN